MNYTLAATVFLLCCVFCIYVSIFYRLLLAVIARFRSRPIRKAPLRASASIILPVHNGEKWIASKLESILALNYPPELLQILVADDGSIDATRRIAESFAPRPGLEILS